MPSSVQDSVLARAGKLSSGARRLLDLVSVIPGESERSLVEFIVEPTKEEMTECVRQGLLRLGDDTVSFYHELTRRTVESALDTADRRRLNQQVLDELGESDNASRLVHHARQADDVEAIMVLAPKAARAAMAIGSHREALAHFRDLESYLDRITEAERASIVDDWARTEYYNGNAETLDVVARAIALHRSTSDDRALARALTFAVRVNENMGRPQTADACAVEAVAILESYPPSSDLAFAVSQQAWLSMMQGDLVRAIELADRAFELAEETGDELTLIYALNTKGTATYSRGDPDGFKLLEEALRRAQLGGYPFEETHALVNMLSAAAERRELAVASDLAQRAIDTATRYEIQAFEIFARAMYAEVLVWEGDWVAAEDLSVQLFGSHPQSNRSSHHLIAGRVLGRLQARRGIPEAQDTLDRTWSLVEVNAEISNLLPTAAALAEHMWLTGEADPDRIARFREVLDEGILEYPWVGGDLAFWLWKLDELSEVPDGIAEPYRLVMEGKPAEAAAIWHEKGIPYERALALMDGDERDQLEALEVFETLGATAVASKLRQQLRNDGVTVPRSRRRDTRRQGAGLTARQAEVLQLLDEGLTNIEIADRLFVSPRTVEHHVAAVMSKLNASTRDQAVTAAAEQGLLASVAGT